MGNGLIPPAVRIALRNAVGGYGPYSVREIAELFNARGFTERDPNQPDVGGERRTEAEAHHARIDFSSPDQARRYLELVDEVLENYPEGADPASVGERLRRELRRAGITRGGTGRLELPRAAAEASDTLDEATAGVWTSARIRVFLSHTSAHRTVVGQLARELSKSTFSCFVAHDAIEPSRQWQEVIEQALRTADVLVAYVTPDFNTSRWTEQEVGWALGREIIVVPVKAGADPYGFFGAYQAVRVHEGQQPRDVALAVTRAIANAVFHRQRPAAAQLLGPMTDAVVEAFCRSRDVETTRRRYDLLRLIPTTALRQDDLSRLEQVLRDNSDVAECTIQSDGKWRPVREALSALIDQQRRARRT